MISAPLVSRCALALSIGSLLAAGVSAAGSQMVVSTPTTDSARARPVDDLRRLALRYQYADVSDIEPWHTVSLELAQRFSFGSVIAGLNAARRYNDNGVQLELQAYPYLSAHSYLALGGAVSASSGVFLPFRLSVEPYYNFTNGWETSAGVRYFQTPGPDVFLYTGTLAKYVGNYWLAGRPYFSRVSGDDAYGWEVTARRYFDHRYDYMTLRVSRMIGIDPDAGDPQRFTRPTRLSSFLAHVERRQPLGASHLRATYGAGYEREQVAPGRTRLHRRGWVGIEWFVP